MERIRVIRDVLFLYIFTLAGIVTESFTCYDYVNGRSVGYDEYLPVKIGLIIILFLNIILFYIKWTIFIQLWRHHIKSFIETKTLNTETPTPIYKLILVVQLLLHS